MPRLRKKRRSQGVLYAIIRHRSLIDILIRVVVAIVTFIYICTYVCILCIYIYIYRVTPHDDMIQIQLEPCVATLALLAIVMFALSLSQCRPYYDIIIIEFSFSCYHSRHSLSCFLECITVVALSL